MVDNVNPLDQPRVIVTTKDSEIDSIRSHCAEMTASDDEGKDDYISTDNGA